MKAELLVKERHTFWDGSSFAEIVIWKVPAAVEGSEHGYKYRLAFVVEEVCVVRYDNERSKGDHRHYGDIEESYRFKDIDMLLEPFNASLDAFRHARSINRSFMAGKRTEGCVQEQNCLSHCLQVKITNSPHRLCDK